jgi:hypothetical protein
MVDVRQSHAALHRSTNSLSLAPIIETEPRLMDESDLPWLRKLFGKKYDPGFDPISTEGWYKNIVLKNPLMFYPARTDNAFLIAILANFPWLPNQHDCHILCVCADDGAVWETLALLRASIEWARGRRCSKWILAGDTAFDLAPMARRLNADEISPRFSISL